MLSQFKVGMEVVCINDSDTKYIKKGAIYVIQSVEQCHNCGSIILDLGINKSYEGQYCGNCYRTFSFYNYVYDVARFVPIQYNFKKISFEKVIETEVELTGIN